MHAGWWDRPVSKSGRVLRTQYYFLRWKVLIHSFIFFCPHCFLINSWFWPFPIRMAHLHVAVYYLLTCRPIKILWSFGLWSQTVFVSVNKPFGNRHFPYSRERSKLKVRGVTVICESVVFRNIFKFVFQRVWRGWLMQPVYFVESRQNRRGSGSAQNSKVTPIILEQWMFFQQHGLFWTNLTKKIT